MSAASWLHVYMPLKRAVGIFTGQISMTRSIRRATRLLILGVPVVLAACGGGGDPLAPPTVGGVAVTVTGLPAGTAASITLTGPGGFSHVMTASGTVDGLTPGTYTVSASAVSTSGGGYAPTAPSQSVSVPASTSRVPVAVTYAQQNSQLVLTLSGLPVGTNGSVLVTNSFGYSQTVPATTTLAALAPGLYTIAASSVTSGADTYAPNPASQQVQVTTGQSTNASVTYAISVPGTVNLTIDALTITQSVQSYDDTVPLVANRDAYLRVFVRADQANTATPAVRVQLYQGANPTPVMTYTLPAPTASVTMSPDQATLNSSWNQLIPASLMTTGLRIQADVDPGNGVPESNEADNTYPGTGLQKQLSVRAVAALNIHFVPVTVQGLQGDVTTVNRDQFVTLLKKVMPVGVVNTVVHITPYTSLSPVLQNDNANGGWGTVLNEIFALQTAAGTGEYFYGVVGTSYGSGTAGIGYVGNKGAVGWDKSGSRADVLAHEVGHNFSLNHAPGNCGAAGADPAFPFPDGSIGNWGLDVAALALKAPSTLDLMGYCSGPKWISAYNYQRAFSFRQNNTGTVVSGAESGLLVWGRIVNGAVQLEPAFEVSSPVSVPTRRGPYVLEGLDNTGSILFSYPFEGELVADLDGGERQFAYVIPLGVPAVDRLARLRVRGGNGTAELASAAAMRAGRGGRVAMLQQQVAADGDASVVGPGSVRLKWNAAAYPMALVRDAATGEILSFARRGDATITVAGRELDVTFSDGVRSHRQRMTP